MRTRFAVLAVLLLACGAETSDAPPPDTMPPPATPEPTQPEPVAQPAPTPPAPTPPAPPPGPRVDAEALLAAVGGAQMVEPAPGFPAISGDGTRVAFALVAGDGGRGNPNLSVRFYRVTNGRKDEEISVLTPDEAEAGRTPAIEQQVRDRSTQVATKLQEGAFHSMTFLVRFDGEQEGTVEGTGSGLKIAWNTDNGTVTVTDEPGGAQRFQKRLRGVHVRGPDCPPTLDPLLRGAWVDTTAGALVLEVAYQGSDSCWEPSNDVIVARLRPASHRAASAAPQRSEF